MLQKCLRNFRETKRKSQKEMIKTLLRHLRSTKETLYEIQ